MANIRTRLDQRPMAPMISFIRWDYLCTTVFLGLIVLIRWSAP